MTDTQSRPHEERRRKKGEQIVMPIRIRVGLNERRPTFIPDVGEPLYTMDDKRLWVGDGETPGGIPVTVSQWPINSIKDLKKLEDAELGDFAFFRNQTRCFMLTAPPPHGKRAWMELKVEPLRSDNYHRAETRLEKIETFLNRWVLEQGIIEMMDDLDEKVMVTNPTLRTKETIRLLMRDRKKLVTFLQNEKPRFPELEFKQYDLL